MVPARGEIKGPPIEAVLRPPLFLEGLTKGLRARDRVFSSV